jgi:molybdopterin converting factor small subunit
MTVNVKCFANLAKHGVCDYKENTSYDIQPGGTVNDLIDTIGLDHDDIKLIFVNQNLVSPETPLHDGDTVALAPHTGGM